MKNFKLNTHLVVLVAVLMLFSGCSMGDLEPKSIWDSKDNNTDMDKGIIDEGIGKYDLVYAQEIIEIGEGENISIDTEVVDPVDFEIFSEENMLGPTPVMLFGDHRLYKFLHAPFLEGKKLEGKITISPDEATPVKFKLLNGTELSGKKGVWPAYEKMYLVQYNDLKTGKKLGKPLVHIIHVKNRDSEIRPPIISNFITEDGKLLIDWEDIKDASKYHILKRTVNSHDDVKYDEIYNYEELAMVEESRWNVGRELYDKLSIELSDDKSDNFHSGSYDIVVVAQDSSGNISPESNSVSGFEIEGNLIKDIAYSEIRNAVDANSLIFEDVIDLPERMPVINLGNRVLHRPVIYDNASVEIKKTDEGKIKLIIPFSVAGTPIRKKVMVLNAGEEYSLKLDSKVNNIKKSLKTGRVARNIVIDEKDIEAPNEEISQDIVEVDASYLSNSSIEEFLVSNMLAGKSYLSFEKYPEASDKLTLIKAIEELKNENPIVSSVKNYTYSPKNKILKITYYSDKRAKQKEYMDKISQIIPRIIKDDMTELEKSTAINSYIIKNTSYDYDAYEAIKLYNTSGYKYGWKALETKEAEDTLFNNFDYAMGPDGVLLLGKAVCSGYSQAYYLMASAAGLKVKVVDGIANGRAHVWNLVQIDGEWLVVDTTWNDSENEPNKYLNISQDDENYKSDHRIDEKYSTYK